MRFGIKAPIIVAIGCALTSLFNIGVAHADAASYIKALVKAGIIEADSTDRLKSTTVEVGRVHCESLAAGYPVNTVVQIQAEYNTLPEARAWVYISARELCPQYLRLFQ
ncbi:DUF732 domain-containing protein [Nocardia bovistercoris]|uniref:DUF732 domain-containing protein n=1 Tax=Nocardia bovistercoris TaxID=2785916 RepID=A0A931I7Z0_9NOCA|nr:DUF732 domain-containing protein [Nocardia bovistercoris]MBH0775530.1 DUF732 domain-containing protein [Nocardia bovistercoris]